jgi:hypothetical protein
VRCVEVLVREDRPLSLTVAERTGVRHESPQVICLINGRAAAHLSHRGITGEALHRMVPVALCSAIQGRAGPERRTTSGGGDEDHDRVLRRLKLSPQGRQSGGGDRARDGEKR